MAGLELKKYYWNTKIPVKLVLNLEDIASEVKPEPLFVNLL